MQTLEIVMLCVGIYLGIGLLLGMLHLLQVRKVKKQANLNVEIKDFMTLVIIAIGWLPLLIVAVKRVGGHDEDW